MTLTELLETTPDFARDLKLNIGNILAEPLLTESQRWGTALTAAFAARNPNLSAAMLAGAAGKVTPEVINAAKIAASIMGMNNVYYRYAHVVSNPEYRAMPAKLRMQAIARPGVEKVDFELFCLVGSAINNCSACMDSHEKTVRQAGLSAEAVHAAIRLAASINGMAVALELA